MESTISVKLCTIIMGERMKKCFAYIKGIGGNGLQSEILIHGELIKLETKMLYPRILSLNISIEIRN